MERQKDYDQAAKFGARRVGDHGPPLPEGVRLGSFIFYPSLGTMVRYDDNIYASRTDRRSDIVTVVTPGVKIVQDLPRHAFDMSLSGRIVSFAENDDQNYADYAASARGSLHFDHAHTLSASVLSTMQHEDGFDPGHPMAAARPVEYLHHRASVGVTRDAGQLYGTFSGTVESWDYKDTVTRDGLPLDQSQRDTDLVKGQVSGGYRFSPGYELRGRAAALRIWNKGNEIIDRDAVGAEALLGLRAEINPLLRWEVLGGWGVRDYDKPGMATLSTYLFEAQLTWLVTQRLTLYGIVGRSMAEAADSIAAGRVDTSVKARAEMELFHNVFGKVYGEFRESTYTGLPQVDHTISGGVGIDYHLTDNWLFTFTYDYQSRQSSLVDGDIARNRVSVGAKLRF